MGTEEEEEVAETYYIECTARQHHLLDQEGGASTAVALADEQTTGAGRMRRDKLPH